MLLGRPWFRIARVSQDWGKGIVTITKGKKTIKSPMMSGKVLKQVYKPLCTQTINFSHEVEDDEEEAYLQANHSIVPILEVVDVVAILEQYQGSPSLLYIGVENSVKDLFEPTQVSALEVASFVDQLSLSQGVQGTPAGLNQEEDSQNQKEGMEVEGFTLIDLMD